MADDNSLGIRVEGDTDPFRREFDEAITDAEGRSKDLGRVFDGVAQHISELGGEVPLKTDEAQEALKKAEAAARAAARGLAAVRDGEELIGEGAASVEEAAHASDEAAAAARREQKATEDAAEQAGRLGPAVRAAYREAETSATKAAEAAEDYGKRAASGGKGAERAAALTGVALKDLEKRITELRAAGANVGPLETKLAAIRAKTADATRTLGVFRAELNAAGDAATAATRRAGEYEGSLSSLDDVLNGVNPKLADQFVKLQALQSALAILQGVGRDLADGMKDVALSLGATKDEAEALAKSINDKFSTNPFKYFGSFAAAAKKEQHQFFETFGVDLAAAEAGEGALSDSTVALADMLSRGLGQGGFDVASIAMARFVEGEARVRQALNDRREAIRKIIEQTTGDAPALAKTTGETLRAIQIVQQGGEANATQYRNLLKQVEALIAKHQEMGRVVPAELEKQRSVLARLASTAQTYADAHDAILKAVGVRTPEEVDKAISALLDYSREVELAGEITAEQAAKIRAGIVAVRTQMEELPEGARESLAGMVAALEELESRYAGTAEVSARAFGSTTPEAISRSVEALQGLIEAWGGVSGVTQEQAARIAAEAQKIRESIATLPEAERDAAAAQAQILEGITVTYGKVAGSRQKFAIDILEAERKAAEEEARLIEERRQRLQSLTDTIGATFRQLQQSLNEPVGGGEDIAALTEQIKALESQPILSTEELNKLGELKGQLAGAQQAVAGWGQETKKATAGTKEVDAALSSLFDTLAQDGGQAFRDLSEIQRGEIQSLISNLQQSARETGVSGDEITATFGRIADTIAQAGGDIGDLGNDIARSTETTLDLGREFDRLNPKLDAAGAGMGKIGDEAKTTAERQEEAAKKTEDFAKRAETAAASVVKSTGEMNEQFGKMEGTLGRCVSLMEAIDRLASGISIDEAA